MTDVPLRSPEATLNTKLLPATTAVAVSPHHLASRAAVEVMEAGGNAVDGAIAANAVLGVVAPDTCGVGGDLFALIHRPGDEAPFALNASGRAGSGATADDIRTAGHETLPVRSPWTITVPGCVDGWEALLDHGSGLSLAEVLEPAIVFAENGFPTSLELSGSLERNQDMLASQASSPPLYPNGDVPPLGATLRRPQLAATLAEIAADGRSAFYEGRVGSGIVAATDGAILPRDLSRVQAEWVEPLGAAIHGRTAWTMPPNSQGYLTLAASWIAEQMGGPEDPTDPAYAHALIEAYRSVAWERDDLVTDPWASPMAAARLVAPDRLLSRTAAISLERTSAWPRPAPAPGGTAYFCTRDNRGMGVSIIQSNFHGIGSGRSAGDTGVFLHNRGAGFNLRPGHPNEYAPGRRPLHTLSPTLWTTGTDLELLLGTRGGEYQPQLLIQVAAHLFMANDDLPTAQARPRWLVDGWGPGDDPTVRVESRMDPSIVLGLVSRGHHVEVAEEWMPGWGPVSVIRTGPDGVAASADPRVSTSAATASVAGAAPA